MATLVLTVVGGIVGGPVGAAIGAAVGQQVDAQIFKPKGREGPRLADLKVQASTYGQQIPQLFGTMRVAGSVIWATDLIERRTKRGGGKGRPSTSEYSYAVSLAIALSSRPVRAIKRIWADGNLLRGTSGSFRERCTFRWYDGSEDQEADPLIASALGIASASAFRGLSYAVFEELELGAFGNRIPSLTFEVEADVGSIDVGLIGDELLGDVGRCGGVWPFSGYAASGDRARDALAPLFDADGVRLASGPEGWHLAPATGAGDVPTLSGFFEARRNDAAGDCAERQRAPLSSLPGTVRLRHYEPERDFQLGQQTSRIAGGGAREERIDLPAVLPASSARALAQRLASAAADERETVIRHADLAALALTVGEVVAGADGSRWRLVGRIVRGNEISLELRRHQPLPAAELPAAPGVPVGAPDWPDAAGMVHLFDLPNAGSSAASTPRILIAGAGSNDGWRGADCWFVASPGAEPVSVGSLRPAAALGLLAAPLTAGSESLFDLVGTVTVELVNSSMVLESVDEAALLAGANRAMVGGELLQFGQAEIGAGDMAFDALAPRAFGDREQADSSGGRAICPARRSGVADAARGACRNDSGRKRGASMGGAERYCAHRDRDSGGRTSVGTAFARTRASPPGRRGRNHDRMDKAKPRRHRLARPCRPAAGRSPGNVARFDGAAGPRRRAMGTGDTDAQYRRRRVGGAGTGTRDGNSSNGGFFPVTAAFPDFDIRTDHDRHADHAALWVTVTCRCASAKGGNPQRSSDLARRARSRNGRSGAACDTARESSCRRMLDRRCRAGWGLGRACRCNRDRDGGRMAICGAARGDARHPDRRWSAAPIRGRDLD